MLKISVINNTKDKKIENIFTKQLKHNIKSYDNPKAIVLQTVQETMKHWKYFQETGKATRASINQNMICKCCNEKIKKRQLVRNTICNHTFHKKCLDNWILKDNQSKCPQCNLNI